MKCCCMEKWSMNMRKICHNSTDCASRRWRHTGKIFHYTSLPDPRWMRRAFIHSSTDIFSFVHTLYVSPGVCKDSWLYWKHVHSVSRTFGMMQISRARFAKVT
ncbi:hypothetical protein QQF64_005279 [Cirrhinus molitorella]|uniref:Uncharacterized protein n=1 Tax=Cirrhinus molitorella TaxID=172907 RepID=A0ABR3MD49_9TELE